MSSNVALLQKISKSPTVDRNPIIVTPKMRVVEVMDYLNQRQSSYALVCDKKQLVGIFTERDVVRIAAQQMSIDSLSIESVMTPDPITVDADQDQLLENLVELTKRQSTYIQEDEIDFELSDLLPQHSDSPITVNLTVQDLAHLPQNWLKSLHRATIEGDFDVMLNLIEQISDQNESLAQDLSTLVREFQFDQLLALTQPPKDDEDDAGVNTSV